MPSLGALPDELLNDICTNISSPNDLLSFALTSKCVLKTIIPNHLHYRRLSCSFRRPELWNSLKSQPKIANHCRRLDIIYEHTPFKPVMEGNEDSIRLPPSLDFKSDRKVSGHDRHTENVPHYLSLLADAVRVMPGLETIKWEAAEPVGPRFLEAIVNGCPNLRQLEFDFINEDGTTSLAKMDLSKSHLWRLPNLTQVTIHQTLGPNYEESNKAITAILLACPAIEDLFLYRYCAQMPRSRLEDVYKLFELATWPNIKRLSTEESYLSRAHERFFRVHDQLERLSVQGAPPVPSQVIFTNMPRVTSLFVSWLPLQGQISNKVLRNINYLGMSLWGQDAGRLPQLNTFLREAVNLTEMNINGVRYTKQWLTGVLACVPRLERLDIMWDSKFDNKGNMQKEPLPLRDCLALLPCLTDLSSVDVGFWKFTKSATTASELDRQFYIIARSLASCSHSLCRVNVTSPREESTWITIQRAKNGQGSGYTRLGGRQGLICGWGGGYSSFDADKR